MAYDRFDVREVPDQDGLGRYCESCGERLCEVEDGDGLSVLLGMCDDHVDECAAATRREIA